jgi:hypothetical protein
MGWPRLVMDMAEKGLVTPFAPYECTALEAASDNLANTKNLPPGTPFVAYVDLSPVVYRIATTRLVPATLEIWCGRFELREGFSTQVKDEIIDRWA